MSCCKGNCKCKYTFSAERIWSAIRLPAELISNFNEIDVYWNGQFMTPSFVFGEKGSGDYDLVDYFLVICDTIKPGDIVNIIWRNKKYIYYREQNRWELMATVER